MKIWRQIITLKYLSAPVELTLKFSWFKNVLLAFYLSLTSLRLLCWRRGPYLNKVLLSLLSSVLLPHPTSHRTSAVIPPCGVPFTVGLCVTIILWDLPCCALHFHNIPHPLRRRILRSCDSRIFASSVAFERLRPSRLPLVPLRGKFTTLQISPLSRLRTAVLTFLASPSHFTTVQWRWSTWRSGSYHGWTFINERNAPLQGAPQLSLLYWTFHSISPLLFFKVVALLRLHISINRIIATYLSVVSAMYYTFNTLFLFELHIFHPFRHTSCFRPYACNFTRKDRRCPHQHIFSGRKNNRDNRLSRSENRTSPESVNHQESSIALVTMRPLRSLK